MQCCHTGGQSPHTRTPVIHVRSAHAQLEVPDHGVQAYLGIPYVEVEEEKMDNSTYI